MVRGIMHGDISSSGLQNDVGKSKEIIVGM
jgi:hypothetical protein